MRRLLLFLFILGAFARAQDPAVDPAARERLKLLSAAARGFTVLHDGKPPAKLSELFYKGLVQNLSDFVRPGLQTTLTAGTEIDTKSDYTLERIDGLKDMVVREKSAAAGKDKLLAAFADGTIKFVPAPAGAATPPAIPPQPGSVTPLPPPPITTTPTTQLPPAGGEVRLNFDRLAPGTLAVDAFAAHGVRFVEGKGVPGIYQVEPNMVLPGQHKQVLLLAGERVTSLAINFETPIRRFSLTRIGTRGGASVPTWTLDAYNRDGKVVASAGEERGMPKEPRAFNVKGDAIVRVQLSTDNRHGDGAWATWSSLPVADFEIER